MCGEEHTAKPFQYVHSCYYRTPLQFNEECPNSSMVIDFMHFEVHALGKNRGLGGV